MTRLKGPQLKHRTVTLPDEHLVGSAHLRDALGISRAVVHLWRRKYAFPLGYRDGREVWTLTDAVADWLRSRDVEVRIQ